MRCLGWEPLRARTELGGRAGSAAALPFRGGLRSEAAAPCYGAYIVGEWPLGGRW